MTAIFDSENPQWRPIYDGLKKAGLEFDRLFSWDTLKAIAGYDIRLNRSAFYAAVKQLEEHDKRTLVSVWGKGYRVAPAPEHHKLGLKHQLKAKRAVRRGARKVKAADTSHLTAEQIHANEQLIFRLHRHETQLINHETRISALERETGKTRRELDELNKQSELARRLKALGINVPKSAPDTVEG